MERRGFLRMVGLGVAGLTIEQAIPLRRVWSFPKEIVVPSPSAALFMLPKVGARLKIGDIVTIKDLGFPKRGFIITGVFGDSISLQAPRHNIAALVPPRVIESYVIRSRYSGGPPTAPPVAQLKSGFDLPDFGIPES